MSIAATVLGWFGNSTGRELDRPEYVDPGDLVVGDFRLNGKTREASLKGQNLELTADEFDLLQYLLTHHKRLVTPRTQLCTSTQPSKVRSANFMGTLLSLKKKLRAVSGADYLKTEPWVLYSFNASGVVRQ